MNSIHILRPVVDEKNTMRGRFSTCWIPSCSTFEVGERVDETEVATFKCLSGELGRQWIGALQYACGRAVLIKIGTPRRRKRDASLA